jgi:parvulin-like peptidyl-prolyl isomerase
MTLLDLKLTDQSSIKSEEIVAFLKERLQIKEIYQNILSQRIINRVAEEKNLTITPEEIQHDADSLRRQNHLEKSADTFAWLEAQMVAPEDWEAGIKNKLLRKKLAESLFGREVEQFFAQNKLNFDQVVLYQIVVPYERLAWELFYQIEEEELSFYLAAHLYDIDEKRRYHCGYEGKLYRWGIKPEFAARIFAANPREVISPLITEQGCHIFMVEEFIPAELTPEIYEEITDKLFNEWLISELNYMLHNSGGKQGASEPDNNGK